MTALARRTARLPLDPPGSLRARATAAAVALAVLAVCLGGLAVTARPASATAASETDILLDLNLFEDRILAVVNKHRKAADLKPVRSMSRCVDRFSERWARHLAETGEFVHRDQNRILRRCDLTWVGEDLVRGTGFTPASAVRAWLGSPGHRAVLMKPRANQAGIGVRIDAQGRIVGVLNFADVN
jgi:uncharacterized protein YkwD